MGNCNKREVFGHACSSRKAKLDKIKLEYITLQLIFINEKSLKLEKYI